MVQLFISITILLTLSACDPLDTRLTIINYSNDTILFSMPEDGHFTRHPIWIDSAKQDTLWTHTDFILPGKEMNVVSIGRKSWENKINKHFKDSTLTVFIFDEDLLKSVSPDSLIANQIYSKMYLYKVKDLEKLNWKIEYYDD